jgi:hypothetical protein
MTKQQQLWEPVTNFLFPSETDHWLAALRVGLGFQTILYAWSLRHDWNYFLADREGLISRRVSEAILSGQTSLVPRLGWLVALGRDLGLSEDRVLSLAWTLLLIAGGGLIFGLFCRTFAVAAWFIHLSAAKSGGIMSYGVDNFMTIGLFYLMLSPLPDRYSLDGQWRKRQPKDRQLLGFFRRLLQIHLCLIYFFSGITKCLGSGWWDGSNIWRALIRPPFNIIPPEVIVRWKYFLPVLGISICLIETGYPVFIWLKKTRTIWLIAVLAMHIAIGLAMGMYLFALIMIVLNVAAFAPHDRWSKTLASILSKRGTENVSSAAQSAR